MKTEKTKSRVGLNNKRKKGGGVETAIRDIEIVSDGLLGTIILHVDETDYACFHAVQSLKMSIELLKQSLRIKENRK